MITQKRHECSDSQRLLGNIILPAWITQSMLGTLVTKKDKKKKKRKSKNKNNTKKNHSPLIDSHANVCLVMKMWQQKSELTPTSLFFSVCLFTLYLPHLFFCQVHIHRDLHLRVPYKDPGQGLLCGEVHFPAGPVELAGFQCYPHGVSILTSRVSMSLTPSGVH